MRWRVVNAVGDFSGPHAYANMPNAKEQNANNAKHAKCKYAQWKHTIIYPRCAEQILRCKSTYNFENAAKAKRASVEKEKYARMQNAKAKL